MSPEKSTVSISWRTIAVTSLVINGATLATLATVAGVKGADALSTIALSLAVLAFVSQLIIFIWQTVQGSSQLSLAQELNASTLRLIADAKTRIDGTYDMVRLQHEELLRLSSLKASGEEAKADVSSEIRPLPDLVEAESVGVTSQPQDDSSYRPTLIRIEPTPIKELQTIFGWPKESEDVEPLLDELEDLKDADLAVLALTVSDDAVSKSVGVEPGLALMSGDELFIEKGWSAERPPKYSETGTPVRQVALTPTGAKYGRLLIAPWPPSEYLNPYKERLWSLRQRLDEQVGSRLAISSNRIFGPW